ncbi:MAG: Nif3-like dinuclear metal center hexameric protein, partial [Planctomycetota bacterium]
MADVCAAMETIAPTALAQEWDNVGLLAGDLKAAVRRVMLTIDLTGPVVDEAVRKKIDLIVSYHPPIFKPISSLCAPGAGMESLVFRCIRKGVAIYSPHTALDAADGGTNDAIAQLCGIDQTEPLEYVDAPKNDACKFVVFVP